MGSARFPRGVEPIEQSVHTRHEIGALVPLTTGGVFNRVDGPSVLGPPIPIGSKLKCPPTGSRRQFGGTRNCVWLDDAKNWAIEKTQSIVQRDHVDYLKHDVSPIVSRCSRTRTVIITASMPATGRRSVTTMFRQNFRRPIPICSWKTVPAVGASKTSASFKRTHYTVATDTLSNLADRQSIYDSTFAFPPVVLKAYTYDNFFPVNGDKPESFPLAQRMMAPGRLIPPIRSNGRRPSARCGDRP